MKANKIFTTVAFLLLATTLHAQDTKSQFNPIEHAVVSQTIAPDARAAGMGDVGVATDPDVNSQYWNPAKYPFCISRAGIALNYTPWLRQLVNDISLAYVAGYYRIGDYSAISGSLRYFSLGEVMTSMEENAMTVKPYEMSIDVAYSLMLSEKFSLAAAIRWIYSDLRFDYSENASPASAFAADLAMYYNNYINIGPRECQLGIGMNISNVGANKLLVPTVPKQNDGESKEDYERRVIEEYNDIGSIAGIFKSFHDAPGGFKEELQEIQWSLGAEYTYHDQFSLRAGYHHQSENKGNLKYFTVGGGFRMSVFSLDVGYVIATAKSNPLDQTLRFTLAFDMDGIKDLFKK